MKETKREEPSKASDQPGSKKLEELQPETFDVEPQADPATAEGDGDPPDPPTKGHRSF